MALFQEAAASLTLETFVRLEVTRGGLPLNLSQATTKAHEPASHTGNAVALNAALSISAAVMSEPPAAYVSPFGLYTVMVLKSGHWQWHGTLTQLVACATQVFRLYWQQSGT